MPLQPGARIGPYDIVAAIGAGGMGEVYRARDTRLARDVAIKVLPLSFASDPERLARFQREAQVLASLNHPRIGAIYGVEESAGVRALVLELVEGPTLADRTAQAPRLPLDEILAIGLQIAEALEVAHDQGIVHRDLKPANIKLRSDGAVKVLDFGLAAVAQGSGRRDSDPSNSPTLTMQATQAGFIIGTAAYMSPEQASGKPVDKRADIWSFGVVMWELLSGQRLFEGETVSHTLADVLRAEIDFQKLPDTTPSAIRDLVRRCLDRDVKSRLRDIGEARIALERAIAQPEPPRASAAQVGGNPESHPSRVPRVLPWAIAGVLGAGLAVALAVGTPWKRAPVSPGTQRFSVDLGMDGQLVGLAGASAVVSPDGQTFAFVARSKSGRDGQLYVRRLDHLQATPLTGTLEAESPFFSPDGQWIGFFAGGKLKKTSVTGSATVTLCDAPHGRGGAWADDGTIVFTPDNAPRVGLQRVSAAGGKPVPLMTLAEGEATQRWPQLLPGGTSVLYTASDTVGTGVGTASSAVLVVRNLATGERKVIQRDGFYGRYVRSGHLIYVHDSTVFAVPFDLARLELTGQPIPVLDGLSVNGGMAGAQFSLSDTGTLVYAPGRQEGDGNLPISWMDKNGKFTPLVAKPALWTDVRFSPDGRRLAMDIWDGKQRDIWIYEWARDTMTRLTFDPSDDASPVWTPDGTRIAFASKRADKATYNVYWQRADGTGEAQRLTESKNHQIPNSWSPDGRILAIHEVTRQGQTATDLKLLPMEGNERTGWTPGKPAVFLQTPAAEDNPMFSPDGRWLAYASNESGQFEVYVRPFPGPGGKWQVSNDGGTYPTWSRTRRELFYATPDLRLMVAPYSVEGESFRPEKPLPWSDGRFTGGQFRRFDLHPDGERFAVSKSAVAESDNQDRLVFVLNFFDELRRLAH